MEIFEVELKGHLSVVALTQGLSALDARLRNERSPPDVVVLVVDCSTMTGYDRDARAYFMEWHARHRTQIAKVAVVTQRPLWHGVVLAMGLASRVNMRAFDRREQALAWLDE